MVTILMVSTKMATLGLVTIKIFSKKRYDVIISVHDIIKKTLSDDSNHVIDMVMWPKFGNCIITSFYKDLTRKTAFLRGGLCSSSIIWDWY